MPLNRKHQSIAAPCCGGRMLIIERFECGTTPSSQLSPPTPVIRIDTS
jgi:hypothetical protein